MTVKDIAAEAGLSCRKLAEKFSIPQRTMEDWCAGRRTPPEYVLSMMHTIIARETPQHSVITMGSSPERN